jgi:translation initiation factor IF-3
MTPLQANDLARDRGLDLVEVAPEARPPVCKIMDYGKLRYDQTRRKAPKKKYDIKTITLRPKTGEHDLQTKLNQARKFLLRGDKVRFQVRMRGRERARPQMWAEQLMEVLARLNDISVITQRPSQEGRGIFAMVEPLKASERKEEPSSDTK